MAPHTCNLSRRVAFWAIAIVFGLSSFAATDALARQAGTSATIIGQVTDASGAVLPGVTVARQVLRCGVPGMTAVTDERGKCRLMTLPIGTYTATYELNGFQASRREGIRLPVGFTARWMSLWSRCPSGNGHRVGFSASRRCRLHHDDHTAHARNAGAAADEPQQLQRDDDSKHRVQNQCPARRWWKRVQRLSPVPHDGTTWRIVAGRRRRHHAGSGVESKRQLR